MPLFDTIQFIWRHPLSRGRQISNLMRFVRWQIGARLVPGPVAVNFVNSAQLLARPGLTGATGNVYVGLHEFSDMAFVLHFLRPDDLFIDVGANVGSYTILAAAGARARCISFEPDVEACTWLRQNINLNGVSDLASVRQEAVGAEMGTLGFSVGLDTTNHVVKSPGERSKTKEVPVTTLDSRLKDLNPIMLKVDAEGFESEVLAGAQKVLARASVRCALLELNGSGLRYGVSDDAIRNGMKRFEFEPFQYDPFTRALSPLTLHTPPIASGGNTLFIRDFKFVRKRLTSGPAFVVGKWKI